ncbi:MAG: hypothetical protein M3458_13375 [Acidobacteriota bacterium]|nr:hypothetical protein [Acidobacteriota bacterium]
MIKLRKVFVAVTVVFVGVTWGGVAAAQRARTISNPPDAAAATTANVPAPSPAPATVKAKYEGGVIGYVKSDGTLNFDDENRRLVFRDKMGKELFSIPYDAVAVAHADTKSLRPGAASVISSLPLPYGANIPAMFIKKKYRYLTLQYKDTDTQAEGVTSFKLENKETLASVITTLANKAGLTPRGNAFIRRRDQGSTVGSPATSTP